MVHSSAGRYGADRQLLVIARGLDRRRYEPVVVLPERGELAGDLEAAGIETVVRPLSVIRRELVSGRGLASVAAAAVRDSIALAGMIRARGIALVHSNTSVVLSGAGAAGVARVPHVWHVREIYARYRRAWPPYRRMLGTAQALACISRAVASQFPARGRVHVIPDGLAVADEPRLDREAAREALGLPVGVPVIAVIGRVSDWKGQDVLVRALAEPPLAGPGTLGVVAGEAWPGTEERFQRVLELARALGVMDRLVPLGFCEDVQIVYRAADVVAVPSTAPEPLGDVAIEAAAAGCAVVASDHGGLTEIIRDGQTGRLVAPGDAGALARVCRQLIDEPGAAATLGAAAALDVRERFSAERLLESVQGLYDLVLGAAPG